MRPPKTADERERRFVEYIRKLNKGELAEVKLRKLNKLANLRRTLLEVINAMIEARAEDLAAGMLMEKAPERPALILQPKPLNLAEHKRRMPVWVREQGKAKIARRAGE